jgi:hypothetical protein
VKRKPVTGAIPEELELKPWSDSPAADLVIEDLVRSRPSILSLHNLGLALLPTRLTRGQYKFHWLSRLGPGGVLASGMLDPSSSYYPAPKSVADAEDCARYFLVRPQADPQVAYRPPRYRWRAPRVARDV